MKKTLHLNNSYFYLKAFLLLLLSSIVLAFLYPSFFMADDWERIYAANTHNLQVFLPQYYLRYFFQGIATEYFFNLYLKLPFNLAKGLFWSCLMASSFVYLNSFFGKQLKRHLLMAIAIPFFPNNFEWNLFPTVSTLAPFILVMALIFFYTHKSPFTPFTRVINLGGLLIGLFSYECLLPFQLLLEVAFCFYAHCSWMKEKTYKEKWIYLLREGVPLILITLLFKYWGMHHHMQVNGHVQHYDAVWGFKKYLWDQFFVLSFFHDYYKTRFITGSLFFASLLILAFYRFKFYRKDFWRFDMVMLLAYIAASSYYFMLLDYSTRRALGGPLYFWGGFLSVAFFAMKKWRHLALGLFILSSLGHHVYIGLQKSKEIHSYQRFTAEVQERVKKEKIVPQTLLIPMSDATHDLPRGWHLVNPAQFHGLLSYILKDDYRLIVPFRRQFPYFQHVYLIL